MDLEFDFNIGKKEYYVSLTASSYEKEDAPTYEYPGFPEKVVSFKIWELAWYNPETGEFEEIEATEELMECIAENLHDRI